MQLKDGSCLFIHSVSLCLFIGKLSLLILRDINDEWLLILLHLVLVVVVFVCFPSLRFAVVYLSVACVFCGYSQLP